MKAKIYKTKLNDIDVIATSFNNSKEFVTTYSIASDFYSPLIFQGQVYYAPSSSNIEYTIQQKHPKSVLLDSKNEIGEIKKKVWRPGLNIDHEKALEITNDEFNRSKRELRILIEKLKEILLYIEPSTLSIKTYGHKLRELLILTCTAVESSWLDYLKMAAPIIQRANTNDYVKLKDVLQLGIYKVKFISHPYVLEFKPFESWSVSNPTQTLPWYDAYNKTKHDSQLNFDKSNLENCILAIGSLIIMQCVRFSPYKILQSQEITAQLINEHFIIEIENPLIEEFYIPSIQSTRVAEGAFHAELGSCFENEWKVIPWSI